MPSAEDLRRCGQSLYEKRLVWGTSGNISARTSPNEFLISATGSLLGFLGEEDIVACGVDEGRCQGPKPPSIEKELHRRVYQSCGDAVAVIHSHPFYSTLVACSGIEVRTDILPETMLHLRAVERVPYRHAGSDELAQLVAERACSSRVLLLENHGVVCWGRSLEEALIETETMEVLSRLLIVSRSCGVSLKYLGEGVALEFIRHLESIGKAA
ncbi:MAG: class II aldolase/adducin family protein [Chloroflexi bacterium]|nr:class II aldolase/adducin family protein [Chloroflexota bacterium]